MTDDRALITRIIELLPSYFVLDDCAPSDSDYAFIDYCRDTLRDEFPGLTKEQIIRCYLQAYEETGLWTIDTGGRLQ